MANEVNNVPTEVEDESAYFDQITGGSPEKDVANEYEPERTLDLADDVDDSVDEQQSQDDAPAAGDSESLKGTADATPPVAETDPFANATETQRQFIERLKLEQARAENNVRASAGKIAALTKQLNEFSRAQQKPVQPGEIKLTGKTFEEVERDWPDVAEFVRAHVREAMTQISTTVDQRLQPIQQSVTQFSAREQREQIALERQALAQAHPDFIQVNTSTDFETWLTQQPDWVHGLRRSYSAVDNIKLLNLYKAERGLPVASQRQATPQAPARADLSAHAELPRKGQGGKPQTAPDDPEAYFNFITRSKR
jgi:hypothetical protein